MPLPRKTVAGIASTVIFLFLLTSPASAHTDFESSTPSDGASVDGPFGEITLVFTTEAEPVGDKFQILDSSGELLTPTSASTTDGRTWTLRVDPPLPAGPTGVRWMVKAPDAHPIDGSFSFTIEAGDTQTPSTEIGAETQTGGPEVTPVVPDTTRAAEAGLNLDEFLVTADSRPSSFTKLVPMARFIGFGGVLLGLGSITFAVFVLRGTKREIWHVLFWTRRGGVLVVLSAILEFVTQVSSESGQASTLSSTFSVATSTFGLAIAMRIVGGIALAIGADFSLWTAPASLDLLPHQQQGAQRQLIAASSGAAQPPAEVDFFPNSLENGPSVGRGELMWRATADSTLAFASVPILLISYAFDGHTVTEGDRWVTGALNALHVGGAAVWVGGIVMLTSTLTRRKRAGHDLRAHEMAIRFSVVASAALVIVGIAGALLSLTILDTVDELWTTPWGRLLLGKVLLVGLAATAGAYNHFELIPRLNRTGGNTALSEQLRIVVRLEAVLLLSAVLVTAFMVGAAS